MNNTLINAYQNELAFMKQERNKWKERTKKAVKERNNLQSKIDKAIEYIETLEIDDYDGNSYFIQDKNKKELFIEDIGNNILDILKEDK